MHGGHAFFVSAVRAAIKIPAGFDAMTDNCATTMVTLGRQGVDRAFKAIEVVGNARDNYLDWFVVFVAANFTLGHKILLFGFRRVTG
jgi:hypothetical protein